jgi:hypothetical protein
LEVENVVENPELENYHVSMRFEEGEYEIEEEMNTQNKNYVVKGEEKEEEEEGEEKVKMEEKEGVVEKEDIRLLLMMEKMVVEERKTERIQTGSMRGGGILIDFSENCEGLVEESEFTEEEIKRREEAEEERSEGGGIYLSLPPSPSYSHLFSSVSFSSNFAEIWRDICLLCSSLYLASLPSVAMMEMGYMQKREKKKEEKEKEKEKEVEEEKQEEKATSFPLSFHLFSSSPPPTSFSPPSSLLPPPSTIRWVVPPPSLVAPSLLLSLIRLVFLLF